MAIDAHVLITILIAILALAILSTMWTSVRGAPWAPTPWATVRTMLELAEVQPGECVHDLGSGDGRVLIVAARRYGARAVGVEVDPLRCALTQVLVRVLGLSHRVRVVRGDMCAHDLRDADVVTAYLLPDTNRKLLGKLRQELRPGARIVTYVYPLPDWPLAVTDEQHQVFVYRSDALPTG